MDEGKLLTVTATPVELPEVVARDHWPVHVTIIGNFRVEAASESVVADLLASLASHVAAFSVSLGPRDQFGPERTMLVLLAEHPLLHQLHGSLGRDIKRVPGFAACLPSHWEDGYRPHATLGSAVDVVDGDTLELRWLTLASLEGDSAHRITAVELL